MDAVQIGSAVRQARKATVLRQDQLAATAGVGLHFVVDLEAGKRPVGQMFSPDARERAPSITVVFVQSPPSTTRMS